MPHELVLADRIVAVNGGRVEQVGLPLAVAGAKIEIAADPAHVGLLP